ncbi:collagen alpha-1(II) chain-like [Hippopotamus amphibius kiboko]|uniref:collagen alpha-1(II) chain-like n=1 Tax=Hippopotamus amphibius kiboko TaxID=575201 RepID=UPI00259A0DB9|nr:collagen alpha-1(II) chain-like [Hippopotamus amphibius kiboko]
MTHGGWQGSGEAGPGPRSSPQQMPARPSLPRWPNPLRARGCGSALRISWTRAARTRPAPPAGARRVRAILGRGAASPPASAVPAGHSGKLLGPWRREGRKGGERRRRGPGGQQPSPPGSEERVKPVNPVCHFPADFRGEVLQDAPR